MKSSNKAKSDLENGFIDMGRFDGSKESQTERSDESKAKVSPTFYELDMPPGGVAGPGK